MPEPAGPTLVVMTDDAQANRGPALVVGRLVDIVLARRVLDALAQTVHHLRTGTQDRPQIVVRGGEAVAAGQLGVGKEIGKDGVDVNYVAGGPVGIMDPGQGDAQGPMVGREIHDAAITDWPAIDTVDWPHRADLTAGIDAKGCGRAVHCDQQQDERECAASLWDVQESVERFH